MPLKEIGLLLNMMSLKHILGESTKLYHIFKGHILHHNFTSWSIMIEYILYHFSGLKVVKDSSAELYNPTERSTIGRQMKAHKNALSHLKEVNTIHISHSGHQSNYKYTICDSYI